jgi:hypothetical protein
MRVSGTLYGVLTDALQLTQANAGNSIRPTPQSLAGFDQFSGQGLSARHRKTEMK